MHDSGLRRLEGTTLTRLDQGQQNFPNFQKMSSDNEDQMMLDMPEDSIAPIAIPMASDKLLKRIYKLVSKATKEKSVKRGVKETVKAIRKKAKGYCTCIQ